VAIWRATQGFGSVAKDARRIGGKDPAVFDFQGHGFAAIQAWSIDRNRLTWEQPANCQLFKPSLGKPFLLTPHGDAILGGLVVEGRE